MFKKIKNKINNFGKEIGIDLGTKNTLVYVGGQGIVINEPSVVAVNTRTTEILEIGQEAKKMVGKTPGHILAVKPLVDGVISDFEVTEKMLKYFIKKISGQGWSFARPKVIIGVPLEVSEVEKKAVEDAARNAGAGKVFVVEEVMASAVGARLPITEATATMLVDIGGGTTDIAVISLSGVVCGRSLKIAGNEFDNNIIEYIRNEFNLLIGEQLAEKIKNNIGSATAFEELRDMEIRGRDMVNGLPRAITINDSQIREALKKTVLKIVENIKQVLESTPPELVADIYEKGIYLSGGGAMLHGLDRLVASAAKIPVTVVDEPLTAMVRGTGLLFKNPELLEKISLDSNNF